MIRADKYELKALNSANHSQPTAHLVAIDVTCSIPLRHLLAETCVKQVTVKKIQPIRGWLLLLLNLINMGDETKYISPWAAATRQIPSGSPPYTSQPGQAGLTLQSVTNNNDLS